MWNASSSWLVHKLWQHLTTSLFTHQFKAAENDEIQYFLAVFWWIASILYHVINVVRQVCYCCWISHQNLEPINYESDQSRKNISSFHLEREREKGGGRRRWEEAWKEEKIKIVPDKWKEVEIKGERCEKGSVGGQKTQQGRKMEAIRKLILAGRMDVQALRRLHFCCPVPSFNHLLQVVKAILRISAFTDKIRLQHTKSQYLLSLAPLGLNP